MIDPSLGSDRAGAGVRHPSPLLTRRVVLVTVALLVVLTAASVLAGRLFGITLTIDAEPARRWVEARGALGPAAFVGVMALSVLFAPIPNAPILIAAGLIWGPWLGTLLSLAGLIVGSAMAFHAARILGRHHLARLVGLRTAQRMDRVAVTMGGKVIFWSRMLPALSFDWISFVAGMTSIRFSVFIASSAAGLVLPTGIIVAAGDGLGRDPRLTLAMAGLWVIGVAATAFHFWRGRRRQAPITRAEAHELES